MGTPAFGGSPFLSQPDPGKPTPLASKARAGRRSLAKLAAARDAVGQLPTDEGDSLSVLLTGVFDPVVLLQVIVEELSRKYGAVSRLRIASLSTSKRCTEVVAGLIDSGTVAGASVLLSEFQRRHDKEIFRHTRETLTEARGATVAAQRSHIKAWLLEFSDGRKLCVTGSANLRSSRNVELMTLAWDAAKHDWLAGWIDHQVSTGKTHEEDGQADDEEDDGEG